MTDYFHCQSNEYVNTPIRGPIRLYMLLTRIRRDEALNCGGSHDHAPMDIAARLKKAVNQLKATGIDVEHGRVDYRNLASSEAFQEYVDTARMLRAFDLDTLRSREEKLAFWINLYNALMIHAVIIYGVKQSITEVRGVFDRAAYIINGCRFSANDIEHGILRANAGHVLFPGGQFADDDPRRAYCLTTLDPRVHFALVCASRSCPPIGIYTAENIDAQLDIAAQHFASQEIRLGHDRKQIDLSKIFSWYARDFGGRLFGYVNQGKLLRSIARFLPLAEDRAFVDTHADELHITFMPYDWSLNV